MSSLSDSAARSILYQAWQATWGRAPSASELAYSQAIARFETGYGRAGQFGRMADQGQYNWGALERQPVNGQCPAGTVPGNDLGSVCFYAFPSDLAAANSFLQTLTKSGARGRATLAAMQTGTPTDVATAMRVSPPYYSGAPGASESQKIATYAKGISNSLAAIGASNLVPSGPSSALPWLIAAGVGVAAFAWYADSFGAPSWTPGLIKRYL